MSIEKTIVTLIRDVPPLIWHSAWWALSERAEHARDNVTRPWLAACQPAPGAQPATMDDTELRRRIHAALFETPSCDDSMVSLVDAVLLAFGPALDERAEYRAEAKQLGKDAGAFHAALQEIAEIIECGSVGAREVPGKVRDLIHELRADQVSAAESERNSAWSEGTDRGVKLAAAERERAALWELLKRAVRKYHREGVISSDHDGGQISRLEGAAFLRSAELAQRTRERDAARAAITGVSKPLLERTVALGKANEQIAALQSKQVDLVKQRDHWRTVAENRSTHIQELVEQREKHNAELEQLREDLAHARTEVQGGPVAGDRVTLRLEDGETVTGQLMIFGNGGRLVNGWLVDQAGRTLVPAPAGGKS